MFLSPYVMFPSPYVVFWRCTSPNGDARCRNMTYRRFQGFGWFFSFGFVRLRTSPVRHLYVTRFRLDFFFEAGRETICFFDRRWPRGRPDTRTDQGTDGRTDVRTDGHTDGRWDGPTDPRTDGHTEGGTDGQREGRTDGVEVV